MDGRWRAAMALSVFSLLVGMSMASPSSASMLSAHGTNSAILQNVSEEEARAIRFRSSMGLRSELSVVRELAAEWARIAGGRPPSEQGLVEGMTDELGVPMTAEEFGEIDMRQQVVEQDGPTVMRVATELFGREPDGVFMDNRGGGRLTVATTGDTRDLEGALARQVKYPERIAVRRVTNSLTDLRATARRISELRNAWSVEGGSISSFAVDQSDNVVYVDYSGDLDKVKAGFGSIYDPAIVKFREGSGELTGADYVDSLPFRGGQVITSASGPVGRACTAGFTVYSGSGSSKNYYMLTAGHCGMESGSSSYWTQSWTNNLGYVTARDVNGTDGAIIDIYNASTHHSRYVALGAGSYRVITSSQGQAADFEGQTSCITGKNFTGLRCGELLNLSHDFNEDGIQYSWGRRVDADCNPGDSGGPALYGNEARGIISVKITSPLNDTCVYTHIYDNLNQLGLTAVRTT